MRRLMTALVLAVVAALGCASASDSVSVPSNTFTLNTLQDFSLSSDSVVSVVSGGFTLDTRFSGAAGYARGYSNTFTLDTRYMGSGAGGGWAPYVSGDNRPVVLLVRGLRPIGGPEDPLDYWSSMNAHLITQLPGARVIAVSNGVFDGTGTVSAAGARLKGWVEAYASGGLVDVYIVAHSMGGLVTRSCLSQMGSNRSWVRGVVMLGTPNAGTAVADTLVAVAKIGAVAAGVPGQALALGFEVFDPGRCQAIRDLRTSAVTSMSRSWGDSGNRYSLLAGTYGGGDATYRIGSAILDNPNDGRVPGRPHGAAACCLPRPRPTSI